MKTTPEAGRELARLSEREPATFAVLMALFAEVEAEIDYYFDWPNKVLIHRRGMHRELRGSTRSRQDILLTWLPPGLHEARELLVLEVATGRVPLPGRNRAAQRTAAIHGPG